MTNDTIAVPAKFLTTDLCPIPGVWRYDPTDPLAVQLTLRPRGSLGIVWRFARQLLGAAFLGPVGEGDVYLATRKSRLVMTFRPPDGQITLIGDAAVAWNFLYSTFDACPPCPGTGRVWHAYCAECMTVDTAVDEALEQILEATS